MGGNTEVKIIQRERGNNPGGIIETDTAPTVTANSYEQNVFVVVGAIRGRNSENPTDGTAGLSTEQILEPGSSEHTNAITTVQKDNVVIEGIDPPCSTAGKQIASTIRSTIYKQGVRNLMRNLTDGDGYEGVIEDAAGIYTRASESFQRGPLPEKSRSIRAGCDDASVVIIDGKRCRVRKLTPLECWRLFAFTDKQFYTAKAALEEKFYKGKDKASSQLYKQAGNTIVIPVLEAILGNVKGIEKAW